MTDTLPAPGWYADPQVPTQNRYWDGAVWTDHVHPAAPTPAQAAAQRATEAAARAAATRTAAQPWGASPPLTPTPVTPAYAAAAASTPSFTVTPVDNKGRNVFLGVAAVILVIIGALIAFHGGSGGVAGTGIGASTHDIGGELVLTDYDTATNNCVGTSGYDDIYPDQDVTFRDGSNNILAIGKLGSSSQTGSSCTYPITVSAVPDKPFYSVSIGHRTPVNYTNSELSAKGWKLTLSMGSGN